MWRCRFNARWFPRALPIAAARFLVTNLVTCCWMRGPSRVCVAERERRRRCPFGLLYSIIKPCFTRFARLCRVAATDGREMVDGMVTSGGKWFPAVAKEVTYWCLYRCKGIRFSRMVETLQSWCEVFCWGFRIRSKQMIRPFRFEIMFISFSNIIYNRLEWKLEICHLFQDFSGFQMRLHFLNSPF